MREAVIASTGNAAVAYAAACARAGIKLWVFMTSLVPQEKLREAALFGAEVIRVSGNYDQTKQIASQFAQRRNLLLDRGATSIPARESMKTIAYEMVEQLSWQAPDWYIQSVSGGLGPLGVYQGFKELFNMGLINRIPKLAIIQAEGCAPMVNAFKAGKDTADASHSGDKHHHPIHRRSRQVVYILVDSHATVWRRDGSRSQMRKRLRRCARSPKARGWLSNRQQPSPSPDSKS